MTDRLKPFRGRIGRLVRALGFGAVAAALALGGGCDRGCPEGHDCDHDEPPCDDPVCICRSYPWVDFNGECVDADRDERYCGWHGDVCVGQTPYCVDGMCRQCLIHECDDVCTDREWDHENCGECGIACPDDSACVAGRCVAPTGSCDPPCDSPAGEVCCTEDAGDVCVLVGFDNDHCTECGDNCGRMSCDEASCIPF